MEHQGKPEELVEGMLAVPQDWQERQARLEQRYLQRRREKGLPELRQPEILVPTVHPKADLVQQGPEKVGPKRSKRSRNFASGQCMLKSRDRLKKLLGGFKQNRS